MASCLAVERVSPLELKREATRRCQKVAHAPTDDHRLELNGGRTVGYAVWGDPQGTPVFFAHGTPGSRRARCPSLDDPGWLSQRRLRFVGVDRPGYGHSDPWPKATLLDCAEDFVRVADRLGLERFSAIGFSGGGPYAIALGALVPERIGGVAVVSGLGTLDRPDAFEGMDEVNAADFEMARESPDDLAIELDEAARAIREGSWGSVSETSEELPEVDRRMLERPDAQILFFGPSQEAVRQGATGWVDDHLRLVRPWPFRLGEVGGVDVRIYHGEADVLVPAHHAKHLAEGIPGSRLQLYPGEGHFSIDRHIKEITQDLLAT
jgi:pimeloyl-ACP methyl ester carboxylesterase